ncbi:hypothetical protein BDV97DRAFT_386155 [Delphinella strobiligena]|nr:hypothetical protein BDV97DRAFT_386155 [Delphinella strobiligena]
MRYELLALAGLAVAQTPGGAISAGLKSPNTSGFINPTIQPSRGGGAVCVSGNVTVNASTSKNLKFDYQVPTNESQITETWVDFITSGSPFTTEIMAGTQNVSGSYNISATLCMPGTGLNGTTVQFLTHGIGFDRYYWDFAPGYSYVDVAAANGYASFFYDRLGVGKSSKPDGLNVVQAPLEVEIANDLAGKLRDGNFSGVAFKNVIGAGHSFGSIITEAITADYPSTFDAAVLTGFSMNQTAVPIFLAALNLDIAALNQPYRFSGLNTSYMVSNAAQSNQIAFFRAPGFDPNILSLAEATKGTVTIGEFFSLNAVSSVSKNFTGPVTVVNGAQDLPFCSGNCSYPTNQAAIALTALYPMAKNTSSTYLAPVCGHGINVHYAAGAAFDFIQNFVKSNGF